MTRLRLLALLIAALIPATSIDLSESRLIPGVYAQTVTGTSVQIDSEDVDNGSQNINVPATADALVVLWTHYSGQSGDTMFDLELDNVDILPAESEVPEGDGEDANGCGVAFLANPTTGASVAFDWDWTDAPDDGGLIHIVFIADATNPTEVRDSGSDLGSVSVATTTIDSGTNDLILAIASGYSTAASDLSVATTVIGDDPWEDDDASPVARVHEIDTPGATTQLIEQDESSFGCVAGISLMEGAAGGSALPIIVQQH